MEKVHESNAATAVSNLQEEFGNAREGISSLSHLALKETVFKGEIAMTICEFTHDEKELLGRSAITHENFSACDYSEFY